MLEKFHWGPLVLAMGIYKIAAYDLWDLNQSPVQRVLKVPYIKITKEFQEGRTYILHQN